MLGRMLSPDPVMGYLEAPQQLDPYGYVTNNPLRYTDPSGYFLGGFFRRLFSTENVIGNGLGRIHPFVAFMYEYKEFMDARMAGGTRSNWYHMAGNSLQGIDRTFGTGYHEQGSLAMSGNSMAGVGPSIEQVVDQAYNEWRYIAEPSAAQMEAIYNTTLHELVRQGFDVSAIGYVDKYAVRYGENSGKNFTGYKLFDSKSEAQDFINQDPENRSMPGAFAVASAGRIVVFRGAFLQVPTATMDQWDGLNQRGVWSDIDYDDPVEAMLFQMGHEFGHLEQGDGRSSIKREQKANRRGRETVESYRGHKN